MKDLEELWEIIEKEIRNINYPKSPELLYKPVEYIMRLQGKRIRPMLVLMAHQLFNENVEKALYPAVAIEVFHNFTLLHDDIMDNAPIRRGKQTVHERWDSNVAILSGDIMMIKAYQLMAKVNSNSLTEVIDVFSKAAVKVCEGQRWDMDFETQERVELADYMKMVEYKTAVLLAASLKIGSITGGANVTEQNHLYNFGVNMGIAFQLKDDLLDVFGNPEIFGKQLGGDIKANKKTFLYLKSLQISNESQKKKLISLFSEDHDNKVDDVKSIFTDLNIQKHTVDLIKAYYTKAMKHLDSINSDKKEPLFNFAEKIKERIT